MYHFLAVNLFIIVFITLSLIACAPP